MIMLFAALAVSGLFAYFALALVVGLGNITMTVSYTHLDVYKRQAGRKAGWQNTC